MVAPSAASARGGRSGAEGVALPCADTDAAATAASAGPSGRHARAPVGARTASARTAGAAEIFLSARDDQAWLPRADGFAAVLFDGVSVGGPIIGVTAGLERASHSHLAVLAIDDLPRVTPLALPRGKDAFTKAYREARAALARPLE